MKTLAAWQGNVVLPPAPPGAQFRIAVEEWESFLEDFPEASLPQNSLFGQGRQRRLVYADAVELPTV